MILLHQTSIIGLEIQFLVTYQGVVTVFLMLFFFLWVEDPHPPEPCLNHTLRGSKRNVPLYSLLSNHCCFSKQTGSFFFLVEQEAVLAWKFPDTVCDSNVNWQQKLDQYLGTYCISISVQYIDVHYYYFYYYYYSLYSIA